jgi:surface carbohydrate biosynthesis protein
MNRIILPIEIKVRELVGSLWLALNLAQAGGRVAVGPLSHVIRSFDRLKPDVYFELGGVNRTPRKERLRRLNDCGTRTVILDTEGSAFGGVEQYKPRVDPEIISLVDKFFAWGQRSADTAKEYGGPNAAEKVTITGSPMFDVLHKGLRGVYASEAEQLRTQFGNYVLINTNFTVNRIDPDRGDKMATSNLEKLYRTQTKLIGEFLSGITTLSEEVPNQTIIIRPHPVEDKDIYEKLFRTFNNVLIRREGDVRPWILGADAVVHNSCTTGVTAAMLGKPVFAYVPEDNNIDEPTIPNDVSRTIHNQKELVRHIKNVDYDESYNMNDEQIHKLQIHIANVKFRSADRIVSSLKPMLGEKFSTRGFNSQFNPSSLIKFHRAFLQIFGNNPLKEPYLRLTGTEWANYKFDELKKSEIRDILCQIPKEERQDQIRITPAKKIEDTFWIETV